MTAGRRAGRVRRLLAAVVVGFAVLAVPATALAATTISQAAAELQQGATTVVVDPTAQAAISAQQQATLQQAVAKAGTPIYLAVLPASAADPYGGATPAGAQQALAALAQQVGRAGTYGLVVGRQFWGSSSLVPDAPQLATQAVAQQGPNGSFAILSQYVDQVASAARGGSGSGAAVSATSGGGGATLLVFGGVLVALMVMVGLVSRHQSRRTAAAKRAQFAAVKPAFEEDVTAFGERLGQENGTSTASGAARDAYTAALDLFDTASAALSAATTTEQLRPVAAALEEGRYQVACFEALRDGQAPPARRPPCFFNPQHGPSTADVSWAPPGGATRDVPACAACAQRIAQGEQPQARQVLVGGQRTDYWNAPGGYAPYAHGYYHANTGLLTGILVGTLLGSGGF